MSEPRILVFCKAPIPGRAKTRLMPLLGPQGAAQLHAELATRLISTALEVAPHRVELWCDPNPDHGFFDAFDCECFAQQGDGLGERMAFAFQDCLAHRADRAVLVGTDCVNLDAAYLGRALAALADHDAVIGPAEDGGYGLIGLCGHDPDVFAGISWSTDTVCAETCRRLNRAGLNFSLMPLLWDVDRPEDVGRYHRL